MEYPALTANCPVWNVRRVPPSALFARMGIIYLEILAQNVLRCVILALIKKDVWSV
jgi:hypothetical protein